MKWQTVLNILGKYFVMVGLIALSLERFHFLYWYYVEPLELKTIFNAPYCGV